MKTKGKPQGGKPRFFPCDICGEETDDAARCKKHGDRPQAVKPKHGAMGILIKHTAYDNRKDGECERRRARARSVRKSLADEIHAFELQCREGEYTDTGRAWELLTRAERALRSSI